MHTSTGLILPLKRFNKSKKNQILEVAGIRSYTNKQELKEAFIKEHKEALKECFINRLDICVDMEKVPLSVSKKLNAKRVAKPYKNTTYWKTTKEGKSNNYFDVKIYDKKLKEKLDYPLMRLEFCFKSAYLKNIKLCEIDTKLFTKMQKVIFDYAGLKAKILPL